VVYIIFCISLVHLQGFADISESKGSVIPVPKHCTKKSI